MNIGCSSFSWETLDKKHLLGRTYDQFGTLKANRIAVVPRNYKMRTEITELSPFYITARYTFTGMSVTGLHAPVMVDGINEKGLIGALLHYPGYAVYDTQSSASNINIHPGFLLNYMLGQFATVDEVAKHIPHINLTDEKIFGQNMPVHYIFMDTTGETIIIEPDHHDISLHRNTIGVMTNSPDYLWHKTNLRNYAGVTNLHKPIHPSDNHPFPSFGKGANGAFGLPGDYSSTSRFVRMAILKHYAVKGKNEVDGITKMFHNFASVDIPEGILKADYQQENYEQTLCISAMCSESLTYYFSTASNRRISAIRLSNELANTEMKLFDLQENQDILYLN